MFSLLLLMILAPLDAWQRMVFNWWFAAPIGELPIPTYLNGLWMVSSCVIWYDWCVDEISFIWWEVLLDIIGNPVDMNFQVILYQAHLFSSNWLSEVWKKCSQYCAPIVSFRPLSRLKSRVSRLIIDVCHLRILLLFFLRILFLSELWMVYSLSSVSSVSIIGILIDTRCEPEELEFWPVPYIGESD